VGLCEIKKRNRWAGISTANPPKQIAKNEKKEEAKMQHSKLHHGNVLTCIAIHCNALQLAGLTTGISTSK
jgi:hypothetical protein